MSSDAPGKGQIMCCGPTREASVAGAGRETGGTREDSWIDRIGIKQDLGSHGKKSGFYVRCKSSDLTLLQRVTD